MVDEIQYGRVKEVFLEARRLEGEALERFLADACSDDAELRREVLSLLAESSDVDEFLEQPVFEHGMLDALDKSDEDSGPRLPDYVGPYRILSILGAGGMGIVYLAEQQNPRRKVALKVLRFDASSPTTLKRFEREAVVLGRLHHPGIAHVFEAGTAATDAGEQPFIAMEYVAGRPMLDFATKNGLSVRDKLRLVVRVCGALQYAHDEGVVHRDLKSGNILVDDAGDPKILDFGVARLVETTDSVASLNTSTGQVVGTLAYMSPEQAVGATDQIDGRTDVYSLGALTYELLAGKPPLDTRGRMFHEAIRAVRRDEPTSISSFDPELGGDVETIVRKAMAKTREERYDSAAELATDIRRFLANKPIHARPPSRLYRLRKFFRRYRPLVVGAAIAFALLGVALAAALWSLRDRTIAERQATHQRDAMRRLIDDQRLRTLTAQLDDIWPALPGGEEAAEAWLEQARLLAGHYPQHRRFLLRLEEGDDAVERAIGAELGLARRGWLLTLTRKLVSDTQRFLDPRRGALVTMERRLADWRSLPERTLEAHADRWAECVAAIADPRRSPRYRGLVIEPRAGLVPLGQDRSSGLYEFAWLGAPGALPERDADGALVPRPGDAIVLVLVPGGTAIVGAQPDAANGIHYDADAVAHEGPPREAQLDPYFIGKWELTQEQWVRLTGTNPSWRRSAGAGSELEGRLHPVESVSWDEAYEALTRIGLTLPTEVQWEHAARGSSGWPWSTGTTPESLAGAAHLEPEGGPLASVAFVPREAGAHAPVGGFAANAYGLHDVHGNVAEWCRDRYAEDLHEGPLAARDGEAPDAGAELVRVVRGGCWYAGPRAARSAARDRAPTALRSPGIGIRAALGPIREENR